MSSFEYGYDNTELSDEFKHGMDYSDKFLGDCLHNRPDRDIRDTARKNNLKSMEDTEQALTDILAYIAAEGSKTMNSNTIALVVKTISDTRALLSSGDVMREDAGNHKSDDDKNNQDDEAKSAYSGGSNDSDNNKEQTAASVAEIPKDNLNSTTTEHNIKRTMKKLEGYIRWSHSIYSLDAGQIEYLDTLKKYVSNVHSITDLLSCCIEYASNGGDIYPSTVVFLLIIFLSEAPEKYLPLFVVKPLDFSESLSTGERRYEFDAFIDYIKNR